MIDNVSIKAIGFTEKEYANLKSKVDVKEVKGRLMYYNMFIRYFPNKRELIIKNSLHKCYNFKHSKYKQPFNHNDYTMEQLKITIEDLSNLTGRKSNELYLFGSLEYGLNINTGSTPPMKFIETCLSFGIRQNEFYAVTRSNQREIGKQAHLSNRRIKLYDKMKQLKQSSNNGEDIAIYNDENVLRYEIVVSTRNKIKSLLCLNHDPTLNDLINTKSWQNMSKSIISSFESLKSLPIYSKQINRQDLVNLLFYTQPLLVKYDKINLSEYYYSIKRSKGKELWETVKSLEDSLQNILLKQIKAKTSNLMKLNTCNIG